jgi:hypothetical protein
VLSSFADLIWSGILTPRRTRVVEGSPSHDQTRIKEHTMMKGNTLRIAWYFLRHNFVRRWPSYLVIMLLVGMVGGLSIGSIVAARRTESSFNVFLKSTNPSDLSVLLPGPNLTVHLARLPLVRHVAGVQFFLAGFTAGSHGAPNLTGPIGDGDVSPFGSLGAEYFRQDKLAVTQGRMANPDRADEFVMTAEGERLMGWHVGHTVTMYFYSIPHTFLPGWGTAKVKPTLRIREHLVGTVVLNSQVVLDEVDLYPAPMIFTPASRDHSLPALATTSTTTSSWSTGPARSPRSNSRSSRRSRGEPRIPFTSPPTSSPR